MNKIYKYRLATPAAYDCKPFTLDMHAGARCLHVGEQSDGFFLWALVNTSAPVIKKHFAIVATGAVIPDSCMMQETQPFAGVIQDSVGEVWTILEVL